MTGRTFPSLMTCFRPEANGQSERYLAFAFLLVQLGAGIWLIKSFDIEPTLHLYRLSLLVAGGFVIHVFLPLPLRPYWFLALGFAALFMTLGSIDALLVAVTGGLIFGIARYVRPRALGYWMLVLLLTGMAGAVISGWEWVQNHFAAVSTIGVMFIYRLWIYMHEMTIQKEPAPWVKDASYFFLLPNMPVFLFPAVDYKSFLQRYLNDYDLLIYKKGVQWIILGIFHLLIYRILYYYLLVPLGQTNDLYGFLVHATTNYMLVIRLSGIFHLVVGMLCLFGFNLPRTFDNYFLAAGFSDLWRRLNAYFRDFMVKVFYYPLFFRFRHWGTLTAMVVTILLLYNISWLLHSLQWLWLKGDFPIKTGDALYWNIFGILVAATSVYELKIRRARPLTLTWSHALKRAAYILFTFVVMSILWSLWSAADAGEWIKYAGKAVKSPVNQYLAMGATLLAIIVMGGLLLKWHDKQPFDRVFDPAPPTKMASFWSLAMIAGLGIFQIPAVSKSVSEKYALSLDGFLTAKLTEADEEQQIEGYYRDILFGTNLTNPLADMATAKAHQFKNTEGAIQIFDYRGLMMRPNTSYLFKNKRFTINRWGGRDKDYSLNPPPNTIRSLFTGASFITGSGVHDEEVFDPILENKMNALSDTIQYEFLNFSCPSYDLVDVLIQFEDQELARFRPDYLFYFSQGKDLIKNTRDLAHCLAHNIPVPFEFLEQIVRKSGLTMDMSEPEMLALLEPFEEEILQFGYDQLNRLCRENGIVPVWVYWPTIVMRPDILAEKEKVKAIAEKAGFIIIDMVHIYDQYPPEELKVSHQDQHPNALGHRLAAEELFRVLTRDIILQSQHGGRTL